MLISPWTAHTGYTFLCLITVLPVIHTGRETDRRVSALAAHLADLSPLPRGWDDGLDEDYSEPEFSLIVSFHVYPKWSS